MQQRFNGDLDNLERYLNVAAAITLSYWKDRKEERREIEPRKDVSSDELERSRRSEFWFSVDEQGVVRNAFAFVEEGRSKERTVKRKEQKRGYAAR